MPILQNEIKRLDKIFYSTEHETREENMAAAHKMIIEWFNSMEAYELLIKTFGLDLPEGIVIKIDAGDGKGPLDFLVEYRLQKGGLPIDWEYESEQLPVTKEAIMKEKNTEKKRCLMMVYGLAEFLKDVNAKLISEDAYGQVYEAELLKGEPERFMRLVNDTSEVESHEQQKKIWNASLMLKTAEEQFEFIKTYGKVKKPKSDEEFKEYLDNLKARGMVLESGHKLYFEGVPPNIQTAREGMAWRTNMPLEYFPETGWDFGS